MEYTLEELENLRESWYNEAVKSKFIHKIDKVCREFGEAEEPFELLGKNRYYYGKDELEIVVDEDNNYIMVIYDKKLACDTHEDIKLFVNGDWMHIIDKLHKEVLDIRREIKIKELKKELWLD